MTREEGIRSWRIAIRFGLILGIAITLYSAVLAFAELYTNDVLALWVTLVGEWIALAWFLAIGARAGNRFVRQLLEGAIVVFVLAAVLVPATWIQLTVITPDYADVILESMRVDARTRGVPAERIERMVEKVRPMYTPIRQTTFAFVGTLMTCLPVVLLVSIFVRARKDRAIEPG